MPGPPAALSGIASRFHIDVSVTPEAATLRLPIPTATKHWTKTLSKTESSGTDGGRADSRCRHRWIGLNLLGLEGETILGERSNTS